MSQVKVRRTGAVVDFGVVRDTGFGLIFAGVGALAVGVLGAGMTMVEDETGLAAKSPVKWWLAEAGGVAAGILGLVLVIGG